MEYARVRAEIAGRINNIVQLHEMTEEDYLRILSDKKISPLKRLSKDYHGYQNAGWVLKEAWVKKLLKPEWVSVI